MYTNTIYTTNHLLVATHEYSYTGARTYEPVVFIVSIWLQMPTDNVRHAAL
jgi:hypothetical protein